MPPDLDWLAQVQEDIVDPDRPIIDTHHHLWDAASFWGRYVMAALLPLPTAIKDRLFSAASIFSS